MCCYKKKMPEPEEKKQPELRQSESRQSLVIPKEKPVVLYPEKVKTPKEISEIAATLLEFKDNNKQFTNCRLEVCRHEDGWFVSLHLDPVKWFDTLKRDSETKFEDVIEKTAKWIEEVRCDFEYEPRTHVSAHEAIPPKEYCPYPVTCKKNHLHSKTYCSALVSRRGSKEGPCQFYLDENLLIEKINLQTGLPFAVLARRDTMRELLVTPFPSVLHINNDCLAKCEDFWRMVFQYVDNNIGNLKPWNEYPVSTLALNFGEWETNQFKDAYAIECHGHLHVQITEEFVQHVTQGNNPIGAKWRPLVGREDDPPNYRLKNCRLLEQERFFSYMMRDIRDIKSRILNIENLLIALPSWVQSDADKELYKNCSMMRANYFILSKKDLCEEFVRRN